MYGERFRSFCLLLFLLSKVASGSQVLPYQAFSRLPEADR
jgi:hypothetical protein